MKRTVAILVSIAMLLSLASDVSLAEGGEATRAAADLSEALNAPGGNLIFTTDTQYPWIVAGDAAKSTNMGVAMSSSSVYTTVTANAGEVISFDFLSCGEGADAYAWDGLYFYVDGELAAKWGQHTEWESFAYELTAGVHQITFTYQKDGSLNIGEDCAYVDNVRVASPIMVQQIVASDITVSAGRRAMIEYEVLPENAFDKTVTFTSANPAIATVTDFGRVKGISVGTTTITIASVAVPSVSTDITVTVTEALPIAELFGFATYDFGEDQSNDMKWVSFTDAETDIITPYNSMTYNVSAAAYIGGTVYGYYYDGTEEDPIKNYFTMDHETRQVTNFENSHDAGVFAMAYDYTRGNMYAVCGEMQTRNLGIVDLESGNIEYVGELSAPMIMTLAVDDNGVGYGMTMDTQNSKLYRIDLDTAECTLVGETGVPLAYLQSLTYDHYTGKLFWAQVRHYTMPNGLYCVDPETADVEFLGTIGDGMELTGLYTIAAPDENGVLGDADLNGSVTIADAVLALRHAAGLYELTGRAFTQADVDGNGSITVADAVAILRYAMDLIDHF
ncbi:MAG: Ig-like domain-containing protein [Clostridia bacterium]|nr:Ig-like domain-containing protein [Clostridia bacterium]